MFPFLTRIGSPRFRRWIVERSESAEVKKYRDIIDTCYNACIEVFDSRRKAIEEGHEVAEDQAGKGKDALSALSKFKLS